jgi:hypothetical protein
VENSNQTFTQSIASGATYELEDYEFEFQNSIGGILDTEIRPAMIAETFIVSAALQADVSVNSTFYDNVDAAGTLDIPVVNTAAAAVGTVTPGGDVTIGDATVLLNGSAYGSVVAEGTIDVIAATASVGATPMKTGQTVSYATGDDGDLEAGRNTSFMVLASANPFGNTNRFTDVLGGQTYATAAVIDWSTYDGSTVLGYTKNYFGVIANWATCISDALALSIGTFTSGWRVTNVKELINLFDYSQNPSVMQYAPFGFPNSINLTTSTTYPSQTTFCMISQINNGQIIAQIKTAGTWYMASRNFTVTGTTLT